MNTIMKSINQNKMKQTAVEQFIEQLEKQGDSWENVSMGTINISIKVEDYLKLKNQAKEMQDEQMQLTWDNAIDAVQQDKWESYDDFYNNNFK